MTNRNSLQRFWDKVVKTESCWLWTGSSDSCGYGQAVYNGIAVRAHRLSYTLAFPQEDIQGMVVRHSCHEPSCVNPSHLTPGTQSQNMMDSSRAGRLRGQVGVTNSYEEWLAGHPKRSTSDLCRRGHEFSVENTRVKPVGDRLARLCRTCQSSRAKSDPILYKVRSFVRGPDRGERIDELYIKIKKIGGCFYCGGKFEHIDHIVPRSAGGSELLENLVPSCRRCNLRKGKNVRYGDAS